jgi:hypothetical protein
MRSIYPRGPRWLVVVAACLTAAVCLLAAAPSGAAPAVRNCNPPHYPSSGYFTRVTVTGASCATGDKVAVAYYHCRTHTGNLAGRCAGGVLGYHCTEVRNADSTEVLGRVTCRRGKVKVVHVYDQHLAG